MKRIDFLGSKVKGRFMKTKKDIQSKFTKELSISQIFSAQEKNNRKACSLPKKANTTASRDELIRKYAYLVNWIVSRLPVNSLKGYEREDLIGYGTIGLIEAVDRYDTERGVSFESYAITRIRGSIYDELRASDLLTRGSRKKVKNLTKAVTDLESKLGRYPTDKEVASELSITAEELRQIQQEAQVGVSSLDESKDNSEEGYSLVDTISYDTVSTLEEMEETELKELLIKAINSLPEREKTVIGLYHYKKLTFKEIAHVMDFSESRASQLHARAIAILKSKLIS